MLEGKTVLITGGTKGIGYGIAEILLGKGMKVAITGRSQKSVDQALKDLGNSDRVMGLVSDVRDLDAQQKTVDRVLEAWGRLDVLVANAGVGHFGSVEDLTINQWKEVIDINLTGVFFTIKAGLEALKKSQGYLITIASLAGTNFFAGGAAYNASKFGLVGMTQAVMLDVRQDDVKVTTIMPGSVSTYFNGNEPTEKDAWKIQPRDIGKMVADLLEMPARTLPSKVEVRPSKPPKK